MKSRFLVLALTLAAGLGLAIAGPAATGSAARAGEGGPALTLQKGDHVCIVGNALADRMQHTGYLETLIAAKYPDYDLVIRNLGFAGDEVANRMRSEGFGSPDEWLEREKADVVLAFFGYNESFAGEAGLAAFKTDLDKFIKDTKAKSYSGKGAARLVLFSPTAAEKHTDPNYPDPETVNNNLRPYVNAMRETAKANGVPFIDLFTASSRAYLTNKQPLTINGVHLSDEGYKVLAPAMFDGLFGQAEPWMENAQMEKLRAAVNQKSEMWFSRYRTMDGYNVYGGRSHLEFDGIKNRDTMQREMQMRDVMTENREKRVWAVARGGDLEVKDDNLPESIEVKTNKPGANPDGSHVFLSGEAGIAQMKVPPGCKVQLFADEARFPELVNPVQMAFDTKGRLWVAAWLNYPERRPDSKVGDSLLVFEDLDNDGVADKVTHFLDDLNCPTGFQFYKDGVIVVQAPDVWFARDTDGDGKMDEKTRVLGGLDSADSHHTANALVLDPGGSIYLSDGVFHRTQVESPWTAPARNRDAAIYRFEPRTGKFETYVSYGFANPHGRVFDEWGNDLITDATGNNTYFGAAFSGHIDYPAKHAELKQFWDRPMRPCPGTAILSSRHFPEEFQNQFLNLNVIGFQGIFRVDVREEGSGLWGKTVNPPMLQSSDPNCRPIAADVAPDGSLYFLDWHNAIIGHMQHHLRDPNRDHSHGRIYRMTYERRPLLTPRKIAGEPIESLLDALKVPENNVRTRAKIELGARDSAQVVAAARKWTRQFDPNKIEDQHALMEALWVHQWHNVVNEDLLKQMLRSPEPRARAAAARVLCYWRDRVAGSLEMFRQLANDPSPRVRLEAVRAASFYAGPEAMDVANEILKRDTDYYLDYTYKETTRQLAKFVEGGILLPKDPVAQARFAVGLTDTQLAKAPDVEAIFVERLMRQGLNVNARTAALTGLAVARRSEAVKEAVAVLRGMIRDKRDAAADDLGYILAAYPPAGLARERDAFAAIAADASNPASTRRAAYAAIIAGDKGPEAAWRSVEADAAARVVVIDSIGLQPDSDFRAAFAPLIEKIAAEPGGDAAVRLAALKALPLLGAERAGAAFDLLSAEIVAGRETAACAGALMQLPRDSWKKERAAALTGAISAWAAKVPAGDRSGADFIATTQTGHEIAGLLEAGEAARVRKELRALGVNVYVLRSVREQMRYDVTRLVVEAGKPFEILFENVDMMPHNLTVVEPGAREEIGPIAEKMSPDPDPAGRSFVPNDKRVLAATKMVEPGSSARLKVTAPAAEGTYEYVCTYPEHWQRMWGQLVVVKDIEAYMASPAAAIPPPTPAPGSDAPEHHHGK